MALRLYLGRLLFFLTVVAAGLPVRAQTQAVQATESATKESSAAVTQPQLQLTSAHSSTIIAAAISPSGEHFVTVGKDARIIIWDARTLEPLHRVRAYNSMAQYVRFSPNGEKFLITYEAGLNDNTQVAVLYNFETATPVWDDPVIRVNLGRGAFSPDGSLLAFEQYDYGIVLVEVATGVALRELEQPGEIISDVAFTRDGRLVGSPWGGATLYVWDIASGAIADRIRVPGYVDRVLASAIDNRLLLGRSSGEASVLDLSTGVSTSLGVRSGEQVAFLSERDYLLATGEYRSLIARVAADGSQPIETYTTKFQDNDGQSRILAFAAQRSKGELFTIDYDHVRGLLTLSRFTLGNPAPQQVREFADLYDGPILPIRRIALSEDRRFLVVERRPNNSVVWDLRVGSPATILEAAQVVTIDDGFVGMQVSGEDGTRRLVFWSEADRRKRFLDIVEADPSATFTGPLTERIGLFISWSLVYAVDLQTGQSLGSLDVGYPAAIRLSADRTTLATLYDGTWTLHSLAAGPGFLAEVGSISEYAWSPDNHMAVEEQNGLHIRDTSDSSVDIPIFTFRGIQQGNFSAIAFSPSGRRLAAVDGEMRVRVWDVSNLPSIRQTHEFDASVDQVSGVVWMNDWTLVMAGSGVGITEVLDGGANRTTRILDYGDGRWSVISDDGRFDGSLLDRIVGVHWVMPDDLLRPIRVDVFLREYFKPSLLRLISECRLFRSSAPENCDVLLELTAPLPSLNRVQPEVRIVGVRRGERPDIALVEVEVAEKEDLTQKNDKTRTGVYDVRLFRDGQLVGQWPKPQEDAGSEEDLAVWQRLSQVVMAKGETTARHVFPVRLASRDKGQPVEFTAYAFNEDRVKSATAPPNSYTVPEDITPRSPRAYVISVGVNAYENPSLKLTFAVADAEEMVASLGRLHDPSLKRGEYEIVPILLLSDQGDRPSDIAPNHATKANIRAVLDLLAGKGESARDRLREEIGSIVDALEKATPDDLVILTFSGHGHTTKEGRFYLLPSDSGKDGITDATLGKLISSEELTDWLRDVDAGEMVMIIDACHAGGSIPAGFKPGPLGDRGLGQLAYDKGMRILAATQAADVAIENEDLENGLLSYALVEEALETGEEDRPKADRNGDGVVTLSEWLGFAKRRVPGLYADLVAGVLKPRTPIIDQDLLTDTVRHAQTPALFDFAKERRTVVLEAQ